MRPPARPPDDWWLIGNCQFGVHVAQGRDPKEAKADVRDRIRETFLSEGHSASAATRGASSYRVFLIAGPMPRDDAHAARAAWDRNDSEPVIALARKHRRGRAVARLGL